MRPVGRIGHGKPHCLSIFAGPYWFDDLANVPIIRRHPFGGIAAHLRPFPGLQDQAVGVVMDRQGPHSLDDGRFAAEFIDKMAGKDDQPVGATRAVVQAAAQIRKVQALTDLPTLQARIARQQFGFGQTGKGAAFVLKRPANG